MTAERTCRAEPAGPSPAAARPRVLHVIGGAAVGGTERQLLALLPGLGRATDARLVVLRGGPLTDAYAAVVPTAVLPKHGKVDPVCVSRLTAAIRRLRPDVVQTWGATANLWGSVAARLAGGPGLVVSDGSIDAWKGALLRRADAVVYGWADAVVGNSTAVVAASVGRGADPARTVVVPNGVALPERPATAGERDPNLLLFLGRLHPDKGPDLLVEALPDVLRHRPDVRVVMAGSATQPVERALAERLRRRLAETGLAASVELAGPVADPAPLLRRAALLVVPSRTEGSPNVVLEAMAHGTPVVATAVGGVPELVDDRTGWLAPPDDPAAFAATVVAALADGAGRATRGAAGRRLVETDFDLDRVVERWVELHRAVTLRARARR